MGQTTSLQMLLLNKNRISDEGAQVLAAALPHSHTLCALYLYGNRIGDAGAEALATSLPQTALHKLWVDRNRITDDGAKALRDAWGRHGLDDDDLHL
eukprot:NODE_7502_length_436_cov_313.745407.p2 GENE.NODE_7502_length_436_cov_313.745407~~NODE_7502_length_436_cov_313.745407.p2  ORF type:complete len:97 (+),score=26.34 NODE_7502_length_436_cov_313.745407:3-293(+)